jgi:hypothetical protein
MISDKQVLLSIGDGPEGFEFYTSEEEAVVNWADDIPALYLTVSLDGVQAKFGPFKLKSIREKMEFILGEQKLSDQLAEALKSFRDSDKGTYQQSVQQCEAALAQHTERRGNDGKTNLKVEGNLER